jgi:putative ABC transport system substrate-binding protein
MCCPAHRAAMRRRDFIKVIVGSAAAWPLGARAQEPGRIYRVALIVPVGRDEPAIIAFLDELRSQGFVEGENLIVVPGFLAKNEQVDTIVPATIQAAPDVIATGGDLISSLDKSSLMQSANIISVAS